MKANKKFKNQKRQKSSYQGKSSIEKEKKCFQKEIIEAPFESNINTVVENHLIRNDTF